MADLMWSEETVGTTTLTYSSTYGDPAGGVLVWGAVEGTIFCLAVRDAVSVVYSCTVQGSIF